MPRARKAPRVPAARGRASMLVILEQVTTTLLSSWHSLHRR